MQHMCQSVLYHEGNYRKDLVIMTFCVFVYFVFLVFCQTSMIAYMVITVHFVVLKLTRGSSAPCMLPKSAHRGLNRNV